MKLQYGIAELQKWFSANHKIMNDGKPTICIGDYVIRASFSVTDLDVVLFKV